MDPRRPDYWRQHARRYDRVTLLLNRRLPALASDLARQLEGQGPMLEIAAGTGLLTVELCSRRGVLVASDRSCEMLGVLRERLAGAGGRALVGVLDALMLPFAGGAFDAVVMANLLHLLPDAGSALDEARRVLRPGGLLAVPTFAHAETTLARGVSHLLGLSGFPIVTRFRGDALARLVAARGFEVTADRVVPGVLPICDVRARRP